MLFCLEAHDMNLMFLENGDLAVVHWFDQLPVGEMDTFQCESTLYNVYVLFMWSCGRNFLYCRKKVFSLLLFLTFFVGLYSNDTMDKIM